jgi:hypothetical protein
MGCQRLGILTQIEVFQENTHGQLNDIGDGVYTQAFMGATCEHYFFENKEGLGENAFSDNQLVVDK